MEFVFTDDEAYALVVIAQCYLTGKRPLLSSVTRDALAAATNKLLVHNEAVFTDKFLERDGVI